MGIIIIIVQLYTRVTNFGDHLIDKYIIIKISFSSPSLYAFMAILYARQMPNFIKSCYLFNICIINYYAW